ncbi:oxidoreductase [Bacillus sp. DTU_2020_1000418_1_SI_GHA_SEK_038]|uniref:oxidoreductase n=1 Tax=Bacillus sp. DTU_2020_1000418_1_SI_GHA_SEK_038 TaxID=3077585 RepID=UPI0028EA88F5|nr:oxidoreductase [Bacillus sp. DTU_2020_1000418_1_SI_GHA_SEK_038]WNS73548.1 oxidoreductase [Bacillus sp. DTU_2020_1000418_1_SI_GHA_SEK_038]
MNRKIAVITGASSGFGLLTAIELAKKNYDVIATMRDTNKSETLLSEARLNRVKGNITVSQLDVTSQPSIENLKQYVEKIGRIDLLFNNAGYASAGFVEEIPIDEYRKQFETNFFGAIAVTQSFLPLMRSQGKGTIINMSSISGRMGFPGMSPYVSSKHALEGWSECLRLEMKPFGVKVVLIEAGSYKTNIWSSGKHITERSLHEESPYYHYMRQIQQYIENGSDSFGDPREVARKITKIAENHQPELRYPIGKGVKQSLLMRNMFKWTFWEKAFIKILNK